VIAAGGDNWLQARTRMRRWLALAAAIAAIPIGWSYAHALTGPGTDSVSIRSVEWLRGHGGAGAVSSVESWWYSHHQPAKGGRAPAILTRPAPKAPAETTAGIAHLPPPPPVVPLASPAAPNEGVWHPTGRLVHGLPAVYVTAIRPDPVHTSLATGLAWMDPTLLQAVLFAGTQQPGGTWPHQAPVPVGQRPSLVAAFNGGFRINESRGGYFSDGRMGRPLVDGAASLTVARDGRINVGEWGRDARMGPDIVSVRQNLALIVDHGAPVSGLSDNVRGRWGRTLGNRLGVWRSGVGVTANGAVVYAAGNGLSVASLANVLAAAGAVRAMELDINSNWTRFFSYASGGASDPVSVVGTRLIPNMSSSPGLYLEPESRDFVAMLAR
jgi:hypothetical protein